MGILLMGGMRHIGEASVLMFYLGETG